jgi:membrane-bound serine protease (ClpP class)
VQGFGILGLGGIVAAVIGSMILIDVSIPELRLPIGLILAVVVPFAAILILMVRLALRARGAKVATGQAGMIGLRGKAKSDIAPEGTVFVRGELWGARSNMKIAAGETIRVTGMDGLILVVEVETDEAIIPREASAFDGN